MCVSFIVTPTSSSCPMVNTAIISTIWLTATTVTTTVIGVGAPATTTPSPISQMASDGKTINIATVNNLYNMYNIFNDDG